MDHSRAVLGNRSVLKKLGYLWLIIQMVAVAASGPQSSFCSQLSLGSTYRGEGRVGVTVAVIRMLFSRCVVVFLPTESHEQTW